MTSNPFSYISTGIMTHKLELGLEVETGGTKKGLPVKEQPENCLKKFYWRTISIPPKSNTPLVMLISKLLASLPVQC
ncbi:MAG: hypothetical protein IJG75_02580, partial [Spirochaetia bacterium]|nr:hypothetical protein [Spirochaetia bacterium]